MTKERRLAIEMWTNIRDMLSAFDSFAGFPSRNINGISVGNTAWSGNITAGFVSIYMMIVLSVHWVIVERIVIMIM